ncbi:MAG: hypothetical protein Q8R31_07715 [Candidatus Omnitrophota bacterium]|nr:hypothetical protein [Candidatus Omnitrophota bacterium]
MNKFILFSALLYFGCISVINQFLNEELARIGYIVWYPAQGGGGPRYLLPIIPFLLYAIAGARFELGREKIIASILMFISVIINVPGLFWSGGQPVFFNNALLFCKNGFHSYMIDLIRDMLISGGFNANSLSVFPLLTILGIFLCWIWIGNQGVRRLL